MAAAESPTMFSLAGRTAIITGAATGIGEAIAIRLAEAGATVAVIDLNLAGAQQVAAALPNGSFAVEADVANAASVGRAVDQVLQTNRPDRHPGKQRRNRRARGLYLGADG